MVSRLALNPTAAAKWLRKRVLRSPTLVRASKDLYRWPWLRRTQAFEWFIRNRVSSADAALTTVPPRVSIETALTCNAKCPMCVHSQQRMVGIMSERLFERLIDDCARLGIEDVCLSVYGEPLVDKHWLSRLAIVRAAGMTYSFFSNASLLSPKIADQMLELGGWSAVNFSVNGFSQAVYDKTMPPLSRDRVYDNIAHLLRARAERGRGPEVTVSCVVLEENHHEIEEYTRYWKDKVERVSIADRTDWLGELKETDKGRGVGRRLRVLATHSDNLPCPSPWQSLYVYYDGRVAPCCEDAAGRKLIVGDANEASLGDIFQGQQMSQLRGCHRDWKRAGDPICGQCKVHWPWI